MAPVSPKTAATSDLESASYAGSSTQDDIGFVTPLKENIRRPTPQTRSKHPQSRSNSAPDGVPTASASTIDNRILEGDGITPLKGCDGNDMAERNPGRAESPQRPRRMKRSKSGTDRDSGSERKKYLTMVKEDLSLRVSPPGRYSQQYHAIDLSYNHVNPSALPSTKPAPESKETDDTTAQSKKLSDKRLVHKATISRLSHVRKIVRPSQSPKRSPRRLYSIAEEENAFFVPDERTALLAGPDCDGEGGYLGPSSTSSALYTFHLNQAISLCLFFSKCGLISMTGSLSVLASAVDNVLDLVSSHLIYLARDCLQDYQQDPAYTSHTHGRGRYRVPELVAVIIFATGMITFFSVTVIQCLHRIYAETTITELTATQQTLECHKIGAILLVTFIITAKPLSWFYYRLATSTKTVQFADNTITTHARLYISDMIFNFFAVSIPLISLCTKIWWLDAIGGLDLCLCFLVKWSMVCIRYVRDLKGWRGSPESRYAVSPNQRRVFVGRTANRLHV